MSRQADTGKGARTIKSRSLCRFGQIAASTQQHAKVYHDKADDGPQQKRRFQG